MTGTAALCDLVYLRDHPSVCVCVHCRDILYMMKDSMTQLALFDIQMHTTNPFTQPDLNNPFSHISYMQHCTRLQSVCICVFVDGVRELCSSPSALQPHPCPRLWHRRLPANVCLHQRGTQRRGKQGWRSDSVCVCVWQAGRRRRGHKVSGRHWQTLTQRKHSERHTSKVLLFAGNCTWKLTITWCFCGRQKSQHSSVALVKTVKFEPWGILPYQLSRPFPSKRLLSMSISITSTSLRLHSTICEYVQDPRQTDRKWCLSCR